MGIYASHKEGKRWWVLLFCAIVAAFSIVDLAHCGSGYLCIFMNVIVLLGLFYGMVGAWRMQSRPLGYFMILCTFFILFEAGFVIYALIKNYGAHTLLWKFLVIGLLMITLAFARDLKGASGGEPLLGDTYGAVPSI